MNKPPLLLVLAAALLASAPVAVAAPITYVATLTGAASSPPNPSTGEGTATLVIDTEAHTLALDVVFSGLLGTTTAAHVHCCTIDALTGTAGVAVAPGTLPGFPLGVMAGTYSHLLDLDQATSFTTTFVNNFGGGTVAGGEAALAQGLAEGKAYFNIHTAQYPGGEIRGFFEEPAVEPVPEPGSMALFAAGLASVAGRVMRKRRA